MDIRLLFRLFLRGDILSGLLTHQLFPNSDEARPGSGRDRENGLKMHLQLVYLNESDPYPKTAANILNALWIY
jgi:hypothetical protein